MIRIKTGGVKALQLQGHTLVSQFCVHPGFLFYKIKKQNSGEIYANIAYTHFFLCMFLF